MGHPSGQRAAGWKPLHRETPFPLPSLAGAHPENPPEEAFQVKHLLGIEKSIRPPATFDMPLYVSSPERAFMELLQEAPKRSFEELDTLSENLVSLRPHLIQSLLSCCNRIKVKRLFLYLGKRHQHPWYQVLLPNLHRLDLGKGKRQVYSGRLDPDYLITVPKEDVHVL